MSGAKLSLRDTAYSIDRDPLFLRPVIWLGGGISIALALAPGWFGAYGDGHWMRWLTGGIILVVILAIAKGSINYVNERSFWTGSLRVQIPYGQEIARIGRDVEGTQIALAFWRWAARSQLKVELSAEQKEVLHKDIRIALQSFTPEEFFSDERKRIARIIAESEKDLTDLKSKAGQAEQVLGGLAEIRSKTDSFISDAARSVLTKEGLALIQEKAQHELAIREKDWLDKVQKEVQGLVVDFDKKIQERIKKEVKASLESSTIDGRLVVSVREHFREIEESLYGFMSQHMRRATVYLFIGVAIGLSGIALFSVYFITIMQHAPSVWMLLARAGLLLAFEGFAMFFLRLYKASLTYISFFQMS